MTTLKYKVIKSRTQYNKYCKTLEGLTFGGTKSKQVKDEIDLLTLLIEKWDQEHNTFDDPNPVELLQSLMEGNNLKPKDLMNILKVDEHLISDILNYRKRLSRGMIRTLASHFKVSQEAFNRTYALH